MEREREKVGPYLGHYSEERPCHTLFMGESTLGNEKRAAREHKICTKYDKYRTRKPVRPIGLAVLDERKEYIPKCCEKRTDTCGRLIRLVPPPPPGRRMATDNTYSPIRYTTGTLPTNKAIKMLHMIPVAKLGNSRTIVRIGERRR